MKEITLDLQLNQSNAATKEKQSFLPFKVRKCLRNVLQNDIPSWLQVRLVGLHDVVLRANKYLNEKTGASSVLDLVNAGPRARFATASNLVSNCLALGYQAGWAKFITMAALFGVEDVLDMPIDGYEKHKAAFLRYVTRYDQMDKLPKNPTEKDWLRAVNSWMIVMGFRADNTPITNLWKKLEHDCRRSVGTNYEVELPSGRVLRYFNVKIVGGKLMVQKQLHEPHVNIWGGFLTENVTQATARDVIRDAMLALEATGITTLVTVHDEIVCEVPKDFDSNIIKQIMVKEPDWLPGIPLDVSIEDCDYYKK